LEIASADDSDNREQTAVMSYGESLPVIILFMYLYGVMIADVWARIRWIVWQIYRTPKLISSTT
jgi:hypothetical protein